MNRTELIEQRSEKIKEMENLLDKRSQNMTEDDLSVIKSIKAEIQEIDTRVSAIDELRSVLKKDSTPEKRAESKEEELRTAFDEYIRGKIPSKEYEQRSASVGTNGDVVPEDFYRNLLEAINEFGLIGPEANHIVTADNGQLSIPVINDTANEGQWTQELGAIPLSDFTTSTIQMDAYKVATGIEISTELIEDSFFDIQGYIAKALGTRLSRTLENAYLFGDGNAKPLGICEDPATVELNTATSGVVTSGDLLEMIHSIPATQRNGAKFYVSDDVLKSLLLETDNDGRPLLQTSASSTPANDMLYSLGGYPVVANYDLQSVASTNTVAVFGNVKNYFIRDVRNITVKRDDYSAMGNDAVRFYATLRNDAKVAAANTVFVKLVVA